MSMVHATQSNEAKLFTWFVISEKHVLRFTSRPGRVGGGGGVDLLERTFNVYNLLNIQQQKPANVLTFLNLPANNLV